MYPNETKNKISWSAQEFEYKEKSIDWFWAVWIVSIGLAVLSIFLDNLLFAIIVVLGAFTLSLQSVKKPRMIEFETNDEGVIIDKKLYLYNTLESFWIIGKEKKAIIKSKKLVVPFLILPLENTDQRYLREYLLGHIKEEEMSEPMAHAIMEKLGF
ncbi:MAG: Uncharacterized protein Athens071416_210 [Parcubacteria group bacterium Athens0714_16]|nr:MAG: Uncharacterized protein Athens071416_210 [Parcubacteria group bacterium Athens0714_16]